MDQTFVATQGDYIVCPRRRCILSELLKLSDVKVCNEDDGHHTLLDDKCPLFYDKVMDQIVVPTKGFKVAYCHGKLRFQRAILLKSLTLSSDAKVYTEDGWSFYVHQSILADKCPFFKDLFSNFPNDTEPILIRRFRGDTLLKVFQFIYIGYVHFNENNFLDILLLSDFLQIEKLYVLAIEFTESVLSIENCLQVFIASRKLNDKKLYLLSVRFMINNIKKMRDEVDFLKSSRRKNILEKTLSVTEIVKDEIYCLLTDMKIGV